MTSSYQLKRRRRAEFVRKSLAGFDEALKKMQHLADYLPNVLNADLRLTTESPYSVTDQDPLDKRPPLESVQVSRAVAGR